MTIDATAAYTEDPAASTDAHASVRVELTNTADEAVTVHDLIPGAPLRAPYSQDVVLRELVLVPPRGSVTIDVKVSTGDAGTATPSVPLFEVVIGPSQDEINAQNKRAIEQNSAD